MRACDRGPVVSSGLSYSEDAGDWQVCSVCAWGSALESAREVQYAQLGFLWSSTTRLVQWDAVWSTVSCIAMRVIALRASKQAWRVRHGKRAARCESYCARMDDAQQCITLRQERSYDTPWMLSSVLTCFAFSLSRRLSSPCPAALRVSHVWRWVGPCDRGGCARARCPAE